jgi:hypothetical protein
VRQNKKEKTTENLKREGGGRKDHPKNIPIGEHKTEPQQWSCVSTCQLQVQSTEPNLRHFVIKSAKPQALQKIFKVFVPD